MCCTGADLCRARAARRAPRVTMREWWWRPVRPCLVARYPVQHDGACKTQTVSMLVGRRNRSIHHLSSDKFCSHVPRVPQDQNILRTCKSSRLYRKFDSEMLCDHLSKRFRILVAKETEIASHRGTQWVGRTLKSNHTSAAPSRRAAAARCPSLRLCTGAIDVRSHHSLWLAQSQ